MRNAHSSTGDGGAQLNFLVCVNRQASNLEKEKRDRYHNGRRCSDVLEPREVEKEHHKLYG